MKGKITVRDVAKHVGVSVATVSNVINGVNKVSEETKNKVLCAVGELNYQPDYAARILLNKRSNLLGIMLPVTEANDDASILLKDNPFYAEFVSGVEYKAGQSGYDILMIGTRPGQNCEDWIRRRHIDGIIALGFYPQVLLNEMISYDVPIVLIDTYEEHQNNIYNIGIDDKAGGELAVNHLIELGHRKIAFASGNIFTSNVNYNRYEGYKDVLNKAGIPIAPNLIFQDSVSFEGGYRIGQRILNSNKDITAIFAVADILALGLIKAFIEYGKKVPDDYSVIGFDNLKLGEYFYPGLTTVGQNIFNKGVVAAETLIKGIESNNNIDGNIILPIELVIRKSTKRI